MKYSLSLSMSTADRWDLAPGEAISQNPPIRGVHGERTPPCPPPTLDTQEFLDQIACSEDCSSVDSLADFDLAPGEARSQIPFGTFYESQLPQCPPPTLDTQEFENNIECKNVWIVEDSLACSDLAQIECRSQGPVVDVPDSPEHFCPPSLESHELEISRRISDNVWLVEDSLACWDCAPGETRSEEPRNQFNDFKSQGFPSSIDGLGCRTDDKEQKNRLPSNFTLVNCILEADKSRTIGSNLLHPLSASAAKRSLSSTSPHGGNEKPHKQVKLDHDVSNDLHPVPSAERSICGESHWKVSTLTDNENMKKQNLEFARSENFGLGPLSSSKSPTKSNSDMLSCLSESYEVIWANKLSEDVSDCSGYPSKHGAVSESHEPVDRTEVDAKSLVQKTGSDGQSTAKVQDPLDFEPFFLSLDFEPVTSPKLGKPNGEGWLCPRDGKKFGPTSKQLSLDRWISLV